MRRLMGLFLIGMSAAILTPQMTGADQHNNNSDEYEEREDHRSEAQKAADEAKERRKQAAGPGRAQNEAPSGPGP